MLKHNKKSGFSFIELMVVIAILAVLLAVLAPSLLSYVENSRMQKDDSAMEEVVNAVQLAITDSATFDEVYSYCIPNNYVTYTDSSGKYANRTMDEEFWAPDGSGAAVTITFNPENGKYNISEGIVNDMTFGNGSVAEKRTAEGVQQCYLYEMGKSLLYSNVKQTIGDSVKERSATYKNSSYTVFIRFKIVDGTRQADVYGLFNGTNLSEGCPAAIGSNTSSYDEENKPISTTPSGGHQNSSFTNTDLTGGGSLGGFDPSKPLPTYRQCKKGHTFDPTNPVLSERCKCLVCFVIEHKFYETGTTLKCERCGYAKEHECNGNPCPLCGAIPFTVTAENREKVGFTGEEGENLVIPEAFVDADGQRYRVVGIYNAFSDCSNLTTVIIPHTITSIGGFSFSNCTNLNQVDIPEGVTAIGGSAFSGCSSLSSIYLPHTITNIVSGAFYNCSSLASVNIPDGITSIKSDTFKGCSSLTEITLPDSVTSIGSFAFQNCSSLTSINIPDGVTIIGNYAFQNCSNLESIVIPNGVTSIGGSSFYGCCSLTSINIPDGVISIEWGTFNGCRNLEGINIPDSVTSIGNNAFQGCSSLTSINIPDSVSSIAGSAFRGCSRLINFTVPNSVTSIGSSAFEACSNLTNINLSNSITNISVATFTHCPSLLEITIPNSVTNIGSSAFNNCGNLEKVILPDSIIGIEDSAFYRCKELNNITYEGTQAQWNSISRGTDWKTYVPSSCIVHCTDGDIPIADA